MRKTLIKIFALLFAVLIVCAELSACDLDFGKGKGNGNGNGNGNGGNTVELSFYAVNDLHGKFMDTDSQPGVDELTTYLKQLYEDTAREEILLASGDMWQGTVESSTNRGQLMTEWMNEVGFVSMTLGNHEYDWGASVLTPNSELAKFPFLAINVLQNGKQATYCQASTVVEKSGVKVGVIGAIGDCLTSISGDYQSGLNFITGTALTKLVKNESTRLRNDEGCDFIVYSIHDGGSGFSSSGINSVKNKDMTWYDSSLSNGYVDLVFEAHTHQAYILKDEYGVYHLQGGGENKNISCAEVSFNTATGEYTVLPSLIKSSVYASSKIQGDPIVGELFNEYFDENPYTTVVGQNATYRNSTVICEQAAKLYYERGVSEWGNRSDVINGGGIVLGGGYLKLRTPYRLNAGAVTYADLFSILPFDNDIVLGKISGYYLKTQFFGGKDNYYVYAPSLTESAIQNNREYFIVVDSYSSTYYYNHIDEVVRLPGRIYARDLFADFLGTGSWA